MQLPPHLQFLGNTTASFMEHAATGIGSSMPPHISIQGNQFALIDAAGDEIPVDTKWLDVCIADRSSVMCKSYFGKPWEPGSADPPDCFSMNGIAPSTEAMTPQARTCSECQKNVKGSATSKLTGSAIKACRDEVKMAFVVPPFLSEGKETFLDMLFQFTLTPGSFGNWKLYVDKSKAMGVDMRSVLTRLTFERDKSGVVEFAIRPWGQGLPNPWVIEPAASVVKKALETKATDLIVGRTDRPRGGELPPPPAQAQLAAPSHQTAPEFQAQAAPPTSQPLGAPQPPAEAPTGRRRRTKAEMEAARAPAQQPAAQPQGFQPAPFRPAEPQAQAPFAQSAPQGAAPFGIGQPAPAPSEWTAELDAMFPKA